MLKQLNGKDHTDIKRNCDLCYRDVDTCFLQRAIIYRKDLEQKQMLKSQYALLLKFHLWGAKCFHYKDTTYSVMIAPPPPHSYTHINELYIHIYNTSKNTNTNFWSTRGTLIYGDSRILLPRYPRSIMGTLVKLSLNLHFQYFLVVLLI
jgi:hypothetical protein